MEPISNFWHRFYAVNVIPINSKFGSKGETDGGKTHIWPFLALKVAFGKFSFSWDIKHIYALHFGFGQNFLSSTCHALKGVRFTDKENGLMTNDCSIFQCGQMSEFF